MESGASHGNGELCDDDHLFHIIDGECGKGNGMKDLQEWKFNEDTIRCSVQTNTAIMTVL